MLECGRRDKCKIIMHYFKPWNVISLSRVTSTCLPNRDMSTEVVMYEIYASVSGHFHKQWKNISSVWGIKNYSGRITHFKKSSIMLRKDFANQVFSPSRILIFLFLGLPSLFKALAHWMRHKASFFFFFFLLLLCIILFSLCSSSLFIGQESFPHVPHERRLRHESLPPCFMVK